jgi:hypothetical protein
VGHLAEACVAGDIGVSKAGLLEDDGLGIIAQFSCRVFASLGPGVTMGMTPIYLVCRRRCPVPRAQLAEDRVQPGSAGQHEHGAQLLG